LPIGAAAQSGLDNCKDSKAGTTPTAECQVEQLKKTAKDQQNQSGQPVQQLAMKDGAAGATTATDATSAPAAGAATSATEPGVPSAAPAPQTAQDDLRKQVETPDALHYKGVTITPAGSFIEAATVWRQGATGGGIDTAPTGIPLEHSGSAQTSEFYGSGRQSRIALRGIGKLNNVEMTAYYEMDWLGTGTTSNANQSNSYVVRQRQLWARAAFTNGWNISGGQMWSLTTETTHGLDNATEILPATIDPQYMAGFVWNRQYGFRVAKNVSNKFWFGFSLENDQILPGGSGPANQFIGSAGVGGGLYNLNANYSFNLAPELVVKMAFEPGWGHWEIFGVERSFRNRVYPNAPANSAGAYNDKVAGGGIGGGFRVPLAKKKLSIGLKGLYGDGTGRMGDSTIADTTFRANGTMALLHTWSALGTIEVNPIKPLTLYVNYGADYVGRNLQSSGTSGYGLPSANMSGCTTEGVPGGSFSPAGTGTCAGNNKDTQELIAGFWHNFYDGPKGRFRMGLNYSRWERDLWSGAGGATNPGGNARGVDNMWWTSMRFYLP
jgi:hypothetical protein